MVVMDERELLSCAVHCPIQLILQWGRSGDKVKACGTYFN
jgi:hypothetical protein